MLKCADVGSKRLGAEKPRCSPNSQDISDALVILSIEYGVLNISQDSIVSIYEVQ